MIQSYATSQVDRSGPPAAFFTEERYVGYRDADFSKPYARFFQPAPLPLQSHVAQALSAGAAPMNSVTVLEQAADEMSRAGYLDLETGYGMGADGQACVACLTDMPGVEPAMWRWWFGWHLAESARYKLWHPTAHVFTAPGEQRADARHLNDSAKYIGNVSYIDEYIGSRLMRLAVRFVPATTLGFAEAAPDCVTIVGRGGPSLAPITAVWLIHQIRRTRDGSEMRSRFYIGPPQRLLGVETSNDAQPGPPQSEPAPADLLEHCGTEMNHLASFLPELFHAFGQPGS